MEKEIIKKERENKHENISLRPLQSVSLRPLQSVSRSHKSTCQ